jgi:hypothetical protein
MLVFVRIGMSDGIEPSSHRSIDRSVYSIGVCTRSACRGRPLDGIDPHPMERCIHGWIIRLLMRCQHHYPAIFDHAKISPRPHTHRDQQPCNNNNPTTTTTTTMHPLGPHTRPPPPRPSTGRPPRATCVPCAASWSSRAWTPRPRTGRRTTARRPCSARRARIIQRCVCWVGVGVDVDVGVDGAGGGTWLFSTPIVDVLPMFLMTHLPPPISWTNDES